MTSAGFRESARTRAAKLAGAASSLKRRSGMANAAFCLAFMTDAARAPGPELIARALPKGAALVLRDYERPGREALARRLQSICATRGLLFILGGDAALAQDLGADGAHFPSWAAPAVRLPPGMIKTAACHSAADLRRAADAGADIAFLSPVFATGSHPGAAALGAATFQKLAAGAHMPVIALGGVNETNAAALAGPNVAGLAAIGAFLPRRVTP